MSSRRRQQLLVCLHRSAAGGSRAMQTHQNMKCSDTPCGCQGGGGFAMLALDEHLSVLYIQATEASPEILLRGARRIRRNLRSTDTIFLWQRICVVVLPGTTIAGAQAVVRRVSELL